MQPAHDPPLHAQARPSPPLARAAPRAADRRAPASPLPETLAARAGAAEARRRAVLTIYRSAPSWPPTACTVRDRRHFWTWAQCLCAQQDPFSNPGPSTAVQEERGARCSPRGSSGELAAAVSRQIRSRGGVRGWITRVTSPFSRCSMAAMPP
eukprot:scaffold2437_cov395-Prasinococcus_capsulatus_cf.AAC.23